MVVVFDTNVLLVSIARKSIYRPIFDALLIGKFSLVISNEIMSEYVEIIEQRSNAMVANNIAEMLLSLENLQKVEIFYDWRLINNDPDDDKFVNAAMVGKADYIVSNDKHFKVLESIEFPKVQVLDIDTFLEMVLTWS
ncbi:MULTISPECIES: putative toxin-antitoxin system toxin component, PIN family [Parapedobacter]|uniref:Putative toxin-antitoxin system toxin component, PIN family n=1 Tax=Parapedobacter indicus TaxID=1477437 RepID=A0A1I3UWX0_9SPHI|nr:putative toxin-antitoxin system toxin component, PIN family [Parapedobacter indicus]PPK99080.1 putative PIN family toxin of toxin-antitoxin system [Parapedobacter indicus]SFJ86586.1 putative toxin-antitoxin system toxin component, PIN family [Parapedobacter indicus]